MLPVVRMFLVDTDGISEARKGRRDHLGVHAFFTKANNTICPWFSRPSPSASSGAAWIAFATGAIALPQKISRW
jgi:hypothetical protein